MNETILFVWENNESECQKWNVSEDLVEFNSTISIKTKIVTSFFSKKSAIKFATQLAITKNCKVVLTEGVIHEVIVDPNKNHFTVISDFREGNGYAIISPDLTLTNAKNMIESCKEEYGPLRIIFENNQL